jgi:hypothetical protein
MSSYVAFPAANKGILFRRPQQPKEQAAAGPAGYQSETARLMS